MKKLKKRLFSALSFILCLATMMVVTVIPVSADEPVCVTIHYYNANNWESPYLYYYTDNSNPVIWPGEAMTSDGDNWFSYTISDYSEVKLIFSNNGSNQDPGQNEPGYEVSGEKWYKNGVFYSQDPDLSKITVHYYNYTAWSDPYIYYYTDNSNPVTWPGEAMTADGDGWYTYVITGYESAKVIFSNNGSSQNPGQNEPGYEVSGEEWYRNGTWTEERPDGITVYFYKPDNWSSPNVYYYLNVSDTGPAWPGTAMEEISNGWYSYNITKYDSAKVLFNDGTNQIPAQNQPGLDAEGVMWYKNGIWCDSETDTDEDELPDYMELILGTNINSTDSDSDGLPDGYEVLTLGTDPADADSDDNNISDAAEDADNDGLTNLQEYQLGTDPVAEDTDIDGLTDGAEVNTYLTDPTDEDTDSDGASDGWEIDRNSDPLTANASFNVSVSLGFRDDDVAPSVSATLPGEQAENLAIEQVTNNEYYINETEGIIGSAYDFTTSGQINSATISFEFDSDLLLDPDFDPVIYWFDEENQALEPIATTVTNNVATAQVTHFSKYILVDKREFEDAFNWQDEYTLYKDYDEIQTVFMIDSSASMFSSDPSWQRYSDTISIASSLPANSKTGVIILHDNTADSIDYNDELFMWPSRDMSYYLDYLGHPVGGSTVIYPFFDIAMSGFDADTANHKILREIVILTDGNGMNLSDYITAFASAKANDVVVSVVGYGNTANQYVNSMTPITWLTGGIYGTSSALSEFIQNFGNVLDLGIDSDSDGIPDDYEESIFMYNGKQIESDPYDSDTDNDGLLDGEEVRLEIKYSIDGDSATVVGKLISDPSSADTDGDGVPDDEDTAPLTKGLAEGIVGEMTIVSYNSDPNNITNGHSFLLYRSYINDSLDFNDFYGVYQSRLTQLEEEEYNSLSRIYREDIKRNYQISRFEYLTFDVAAENTGGSESSGSSGSSGNIIFNVRAGFNNLDGGSWVDWEFNKVYYESGEYSPNASYTLPVTQHQLNTIIKCYGSCNKYSIYTDNCALYASKAWNEVFEGDFEAKEGPFYTPRKLKESITNRHLANGRDVPQVDVNEILEEMRFKID